MMKPSELVELPFLIFIYIADAEQQASVNEVEKFNKSISDSSWCKSQLLRDTLALIDSQYYELWKSYSSNTGYADLDQRLKKAIKLLNNLDDNKYHLMRRDLIELGKMIAKSSNKLGIISAKKETALVTIEKFLSRKMDNDLSDSAITSESVEANLDFIETTCEELWPLTKLGPESPNFWKRGKIRLICNKIIRETHDVKTFCFISADDPVLFLYKPGQFISLELLINDKKVVRSYTISSSPSRSFYISVTVKRVHDGLVSNWLHDNMNVGDEITANGPHGKFNCFDNPAEKMLLISGGSGITPMMSILRWICDTGSKADIIFLHNAQTPSDLIFHDELKLLSAQNSNIKLALCVSKTNNMAWGGYVGRISSKLLNVIAPDFHERAIFVCGPAPYMDAVHHVVQGMEFNMKNFFSESFGNPNNNELVKAKEKTQTLIDMNEDKKPIKAKDSVSVQVKPAKEKVASTHPNKTTIKFLQQDREIECDPDDSILDSADNAGIDIPYSCRSGSCGTCRILKLEGDIEMDSVGGLSDDELGQGFILACAAKPKGRRVVIDA